MRRSGGPDRNGVLAWRRELGVRIVAILFVITGLAAAFESVVEWQATERSMLEERLAHGGSLVRAATRALTEHVVPPAKQTEIEGYVEQLVTEELDVLYAAVVRPDGAPLARYPAAGEPRGPADEVLRLSGEIKPPGFDAALAHFHLGLSLAPLKVQLRQRIARLILVTAASAAVVGLAIWLMLRRLVVQPLAQLDQEAHRLARGELERPLHDYGTTEIGRLGRTLDVMRKNLAASHAAVADQNKRLLELDCMKSQFLANISHEMRTPLTSILGESEILGETESLAHESVVSARSIHRNGARLLELVDRMLDLAKLESGKLLVNLRTCRPADVIEKACARFADDVQRKTLQLHADLAALAGIVVLTDPSRLAQMVENIVGNAVKFTTTGRVTITGALRPAGNGHQLSIVVTDTGIGMPAKFLQDGVVAFRQADGSMTRQYGGSGLGLYVTQQIARSLNGDLLISSEPEKGTTVEIRIAVEPAPQVAEKAANAATGEKGRVLVVDDARDNQHLLKVMLQKLGHSVELADNGRMGVDLVKATAPDKAFDVILMDLQMPELDGIAAIRELRAAGYEMPIVALTAHALADDRERCLAAGATGYETKPITRQRLGDVVAAHLQSQAQSKHG